MLNNLKKVLLKPNNKSCAPGNRLKKKMKLVRGPTVECTAVR